MDSISAFVMGEANRGRGLMVFDWNKAAQIIKERKAKSASAGLRNDWEWTGGRIYEEGAPVQDDYTYLASTWAVPELEVDGDLIPCYKMQSEVPGWDAGTKWPKSALEIVNSQ